MIYLQKKVNSGCYGAISLSGTHIFYRNFRFQKLQQPPEMSYEKAVLKNFATFTEKYLCWSLFLIKLQAGNFIKKRLQHRCFLVNIAKILRASILKNICERFLLFIFIFRSSPNLLTKYTKYWLRKQNTQSTKYIVTTSSYIKMMIQLRGLILGTVVGHYIPTMS